MGEKNNQWRGWGLDKEISGSFPDLIMQASHKTK